METASMFYSIIGFVIITNLGLIAGIVWIGLKGSWYLSKLDSRVEKNEGDISAAHKGIRKLKGDE